MLASPPPFPLRADDSSMYVCGDEGDTIIWKPCSIRRRFPPLMCSDVSLLPAVGFGKRRRRHEETEEEPVTCTYPTRYRIEIEISDRMMAHRTTVKRKHEARDAEREKC